jgi:hypothetical protein
MKRLGKDVEVTVKGLIFKVSVKSSGMVVVTGVLTDIFLTSRLGDDIGTIDVSGANLLVVKGKGLEVYDYSPNLVNIEGEIKEIKPYRVQDGKRVLLNWKLEGCINE